MFYIYSIMLHGHSHYCIMLAVCFSYRFYVLRHPNPTFRTSLIAVILIYLPTLLIYIYFSHSTLYNPEIVRNELKMNGPSYVFDDDEHVTGIVNILEPSALPGIVWVCAIACPAYAVIVSFGRAMYRTLSDNSAHMSEKTRASHKEIVKGLMLQACLPLLYIFSVGTYVVGQLNILNLVVLEYTTHVLGEVLLAASPLLTLYYVQPYRR
ncbi:hypothetical protein PFISCL1PPCAC_6918, partial [Pristionchus fissidentatus]